VIPARDRAELLAETLDSVLVQDQGEPMMRIEVVDNSVHDDAVQQRVAKRSGGRVALFRQPAPVGMVENWNACLARAHGTLIHLLHDDDLVLPGFYRALTRAAAACPEAGAYFCRFHTIDEHGARTDLAPLLQLHAGVLRDAVGLLGSRQQIQAPAIVVRRVVYEKLGGFRPDLAYSPDWEMWVRIACHFPVWYEPEPLACYRMHGGADTTRAARLGLDAAGSRQAIAVFSEYLPPEHRRRLPRRARENVGHHAAFLASRFISQRDLAAAARQLFQALRTSRSPRIVADLARYFIAGVRGNLRRVLHAAGVLLPTSGESQRRR
jgi:glycosyltransferase involved in cell wall biosynthesis